MTRAAKKIEGNALDRCACKHFRRDHATMIKTGKSLFCEAAVFAAGSLGSGECDCQEFRHEPEEAGL